ncbi:hypothetical protein ACFWEJ_15295, partial [Promicromonospora sp. NPDC060204]|uniref:hypothetical protein n=1 Tax=Promicromonospora sp. NPDC060204 TaxID=3347071 RepID=UPI00364F9D85
MEITPGHATFVERAVAAALPPAPADTTTSLHTLCWSAQPLNGEGTLPAATVTWPGHGRSTQATVSDLVDGPTRRTETADLASLPELAGLPVGASLVAALTRVEVADTDDADLLDVAARWQDVISWATAMQSRATGEIARRRGWTTEHTTATAEISARLHIPQG